MNNFNNPSNNPNSTNPSGQFATSVEDAALTAKVKAKMMADPEISSLSLNVETKNGIVTLSGNVPTDDEAHAAIFAASSVTGVHNVDTSQLIVQKSSHPFEDTVITAKVMGLFLKEKVFGNEPISVTGISVETKDGIVHLTGEATQQEARNAEKLARSVSGVRNVDSRVRLQ